MKLGRPRRGLGVDSVAERLEADVALKRERVRACVELLLCESVCEEKEKGGGGEEWEEHVERQVGD